MWQEARKHERHIRSVLVDYRKRAERRLNFYSQIRQDPIKFLRVYGTPAKINLDVEVRKAAENPNNMMPWTGDPSIMIDRFDARANLETYSSAKPTEIKLSTAEKIEERLCNYERYRCLAHNDFLEVTESMALKQIEREEKYGDTLQRKHDDDSKDKKPSEPKAAIGFTYEDGEIVSGRSSAPPPSKRAPAAESGSEDSDMDSDMDIDVELDLESLTAEQRQELIDHSHTYGMKRSDFIRLLDADQVLETELRMAKLLEEEKSQHLRKPRRRPHPRVRQPFDKYSAPVHGPKYVSTKSSSLNLCDVPWPLQSPGVILFRKVYLSGASSDSESYGSPSSEEDERLRDRARRYRNTPTSQLARTKPALFESKRPAVLIGGLTLVAFCDPKKRRRRFRERPRRKYGEGAGSRSRSSSSSGDSRGSSNRPHRSSKRSKVEYITTFGEGDDEDDQDVGRGLSPSKFPGCAPSSSGRPSDTASKLAASVVSSLFKDSASAGHKSATPSASAAFEGSPPPPLSVVEVLPQGRRLHPSVDIHVDLDARPHGPPPGATVVVRLRPPLGPRHRAEAAPIKRYYRRDLESDDDKNKLSSSSSSDSDSEHKPSSSSANCASTSYYAQRRSTATEPDGRRRYLDSQDETSDFLSGGKRTASSSYQHPVDRYSNPPNPHTTSSSSSMSKVSSVVVFRLFSTQLLWPETTSRAPATKSLSSNASKLTPKEVLKRVMQAQLNKTVNAEKKAELERLEKQERERMDREEGLRKLAAQMRQREIEKRLAERGIRQSFSPSRSSTSRSCSPTSPVVPPALRKSPPLSRLGNALSFRHSPLPQPTLVDLRIHVRCSLPPPFLPAREGLIRLRRALACDPAPPSLTVSPTRLPKSLRHLAAVNAGPGVFFSSSFSASSHFCTRILPPYHHPSCPIATTLPHT
ncbi:unnamed protein product [Mesocestoides corti]|uniref:Suppressor of white apricot N-terminal domain-containing protein n=1 Tax=Mesocestoides corti TaxID=53468 RepID=A0A158QSB0_MESCO|nr:unnamed protein product [Mesocestoides corti]